MKYWMLVLAVASSVVMAQSQTTDSVFNSNGVNIHYLVTGTGSPVILLHPFAAFGRHMAGHDSGLVAGSPGDRTGRAWTWQERQATRSQTIRG